MEGNICIIVIILKLLIFLYFKMQNLIKLIERLKKWLLQKNVYENL